MIRFAKTMTRIPHIPSRVKVGPHIIRVRLVKPTTIAADGSCFGEWDPQTLTIRIDKTACPAMQYSTFIHELFEAMNSIYELNLAHNKLTTLESAIQDIEPL